MTTTVAVLILINRRCFAAHINDSFLHRTLMKDRVARGVNVPAHHGSLNGYLAQLIIIIIIIYLVWLATRWAEAYGGRGAKREGERERGRESEGEGGVGDRYTSAGEHETFDILHGYTTVGRQNKERRD